jgi:hypothetical protein
VFAETNAPTPQRAAISESWKLIYYMQSNLYELFDLKADPGEKQNLAPKRPPAFDKMKAALDGWLERVVYARNPEFNQANERIKDVLLAAPVAPPVPTTAQTLDDGKLAIVGIGAASRLIAGTKADVQVYFRVDARTAEAYKFQIVVWPVDPATWKPTDPVPPNAVRTPSRATANGFFPADRWHEHENIRDRFEISLPADWRTPAIAVGLVSTGANGKAPASGDHPAEDPHLAILGTLPMGSSGSASP